MAYGQGTAELDFGTGQNEASVNVTGLATIGIASKAEAYVMADDTTTDHTASDHRYFNSFAGLACGTPTAGVGFTIYGTSEHKLTGKFAIRYVWSD